MNNPSDNPEQEEKRLDGVCIEQKYEWIATKKPTTAIEESSTQKSGLIMEELILWNMIGFTCATPKDYYSLSLVNKEWKNMLEKMEPPIMFKIGALLQKHTVTKVEVVKEDLVVLDELLSLIHI